MEEDTSWPSVKEVPYPGLHSGYDLVGSAGRKRGVPSSSSGAAFGGKATLQQKLDMSLEELDPRAALPGSYKGGGKEADATLTKGKSDIDAAGGTSEVKTETEDAECLTLILSNITTL